MKNPSDKLTANEQELMVWLIQEASEIIMAATKFLHHGGDVKLPTCRYDSRGDLSAEIGDLFAICDLLSNLGVLDTGILEKARQTKPDRMKPFTHGELLG